jgi:hypothetical protein
MSLGPVIIAFGMLLMTRIGAGSEYFSSVLPAVIVFGLGLALTVAPLTAAVLASADAAMTGIASGVNNAVSRVAGLFAVAALPVIAGLSGGAYRDAVAFADGFRLAITMSAVLVAAGGVIAWLAIRNDVLVVAPGRGVTLPPSSVRTHCAVEGTPLVPPPE